MDLYLADKGDLITSKINFHQGAVALAPRRLACSTHYQVYKPSYADCRSDFLFYVLRSPQFTSQLMEQKNKGIKNEQNADFVMAFEIPLPSPEQQISMISRLQFFANSIESCKTLEKRFCLYIPEFESVPHSLIGQTVIETKNGWSPKCNGGGLPVLTLSCLRQGKIDFAERKYTDELRPNIGIFLVHEGDFFYSRGNTPELVALSAIAGSIDEDIVLPDLLTRVLFNQDLVLPAYAGCIEQPLEIVMEGINANEARSTDLRVIEELTNKHGWKTGDTLLYQPQYSLNPDQQVQFPGHKAIRPDIVLQDMQGNPVAVFENKLDDPKKALEKTKIASEEVDVHLKITEYGERMALSLYLPKRFSFDPGDGYPLSMRLECFNSVGGSTRFRALMRWFRFVCSNGLIIGVTRSDVRRRHVGDLGLNDVETVLSSGIMESNKEKQDFEEWRKKPIIPNDLVLWVNQKLKKGWGFKAAARLYHISRTGHDAEIVGPYKKNTPTTIPILKAKKVPGAPLECKNLYDVSQSLAWLAKERRDVQEQLSWRENQIEYLPAWSRLLKKEWL